MDWGPLKSAEKPHPWAVDHEPMGPGAMGPAGGGVRGGCGGGWAVDHEPMGPGAMGSVWGLEVGVGVGGGGGAMTPGARGP